MSWTFEDARKMLDAWDGAGSADEAGSKRRRVLEAATELFIQQGYRKTSVDEVARRSHVAKGTVYLYFANKADLLITTLVEEKRAYFSVLKPIFDREIAPTERLRRYLHVMLTLAHEMPLTSRLLSGDRELMIVFDEMDPAFRDEMLGLQAQFVEDLFAEVSAGRHSAEELQKRARVLMGLLMSSGFFVDDQARLGVPLEEFATTLEMWLIEGMTVPGAIVAEGGHVHGER